MKQRYTCEIQFEPNTPDTYPNNFKCWVIVVDHKTPEGERNKVFRRRGYGKFIGNFSPIWISIGGVKKQLTEWERETY
jgi:hypothetical protein